MGLSAPGCGDALLPSDYAGPPAANVTGNIWEQMPNARFARYPVFTVEWLGTLEAGNPGEPSALHGQQLRYALAPDLERNLLNLDLVFPEAPAQLEAGRFRFSVGKLVYFDDLVRDGRVDWRCTGGSQVCDVVKAVSDEFVVFLQSVPTCRARPGAVPRTTLTQGFHYFRIENGQLRELGQHEAVSFTINDRSPVESDPSDSLHSFVDVLLQPLSVLSLQDC